MTSFFKRLLNPGGRAAAETGAARLTLAIFGKHPGWNDHIPGINVETETLAHVKQAMYVSGIGGRIDAGAWRNLETEKRLEGFQHVFVWMRNGHVILGRMHSSEDGRNRKEYPLVLCLDAEGISPERILARALPELERLLSACQATSSAEQVSAECRMAQERLRDAFLREGALVAPAGALPPETRRRFVEHQALGPNRVGLLRILHELGSAGNPAGGSQGDSRPRHVRLPLAADSRDHALLLWAGFLLGAIPACSSLLFISRNGTDWLDAIVGEPTSDDFFCLQAALSALPLASQIPYDVAPELKTRLQQLEAGFLGPDAAVQTKPITVPPNLSVPPSAATPPPVPPTRKGFNWLIILIGIVVVVAAVASLWLVSGNRGSPGDSKPPLAVTSANPNEVQPAGESKPEVQLATNNPAAEAARLKAHQEEKDRTEEEARQLAEARRVADEKAKAVQQPVVSGIGSAKATDEDVELAQLALARGNYPRVVEIASKWPGNVRFKGILTQLTSETNQLFQVTQAFQAGNYAPILSRTNPLPDNPRFKEILTKAEAESKLLEQGRAEFAKGDYGFLEQPELLDLKAKPPFQKLLQEGGSEAELLKKAQAFKAGNQPQATHDLIAQHKLTKAPFIEIEKWASVELERDVGQTRDQQQVETLLRQGDYARAGELCKKYSGVVAFDALAKTASAEQTTLVAMGKKLAGGDYAFLNELAAQSYRTKPPFAELQSKGATEQTALSGLEKLKTANDWRGAQVALSKLPTDVSRKPPFVIVSQWVESKASADEALKNKDAGWLDAELEKLLVQFGVLKPSNSWLKTVEARKQEVISPGPVDLRVKDYYLNRVKTLRAEYAKRNWLAQREREKYLNQLQSNIEDR